MDYSPRNISPLQLVLRAGFYPARVGFQMEMERLGRKNRRRRYHAILEEEGKVKLHIDLGYDKGKAHPTSYKSPRVKKMIETFKEIDLETPKPKE